MEKEKRGISQITGKTEIKLGEKAFYKVSRIHRKEDHDKVKNALWKIYVKENGNWRELKSDPSVPPKKGDEVSYTITNQALAGKELLVEAYIYEPEKMAPPGLKIKVLPGTEKKIQRVELFMIDDTPIKENTILKYNQTIKVKVYTQNMPNELLKISLYEDDADRGGHNPKNEKNKVAEVEKHNNERGFLWHEFKLDAEFSKIANAMMDGSSDKLHEYYVLVESVKYGNKTSKNVEVENPDYVVHQTYENGKVIDHKNDKIYDGGVIEEVIIKGKYKKQMGLDPMPKTGRSVSIVSEPPEKKTNNCGEKYCIKIGDKSELIREINIRLAGFGGNVPTDEFTVRTEKMIKQFQRDYMKVPETGKVCGNVLRAIDEFTTNYKFTFGEIKCKCGTKGKSTRDILLNRNVINNCLGFGDGSNKNKFVKNGNTEKHHAYEYPGLHRSLLYSLKAVMFYMDKIDTRYKFHSISSGFRCRFHSIFIDSQTTNHIGKALDILFDYKNGNRAQRKEDLNGIRKDYFEKYLNATYWTGSNNFGLETYAQGAKTWVHVDVREFESKYLDEKYFCKTENVLNGKSIIQLSQELGFSNTCSCNGKYDTQKSDTTQASNSCEDKFRKVAPIILEHEGGYKNEPSKDKGDPTNKGISWPIWQKYAKEDLGIEPTKENQKKLTDEQATTIYRKRYWEPKGYCEINNLKLALMVYDWSITSGGAIKKVQELLVQEFGQKIVIDGGMGKQTANALNQPEDQEKLLKRISEIRKAYYDYGASQEWFSSDYLKGLKRRADKCMNYEL